MKKLFLILFLILPCVALADAGLSDGQKTEIENAGKIYKDKVDGLNTTLATALENNPELLASTKIDPEQDIIAALTGQTSNSSSSANNNAGPVQTATPTVSTEEPEHEETAGERRAREEKRKIDEETLAKLKENEAAMAEKQKQSGIASGISMGATGVGGMQMMQGKAEQDADKAALNEMQVYLSSIKCMYGPHTVEHGKTVDLQGNGTEFTEKRASYLNLAGNLKQTKEELGIKAGMESELELQLVGTEWQLVLDKSKTGLYAANELTPYESGLGSISRSLMDETGTGRDATKLEELARASKERFNTGAIVAGVGLAGGVIANVMIDKLGKKENSADILKDRNEKYAKLNAEIRPVFGPPHVPAPAASCIAPLEQGESGCECKNGGDAADECNCSPDKPLVNGVCTACTNNKVSVSGSCVCPIDTEPDNDGCKRCENGATSDGTKVCEKTEEGCNIAGQEKDDDKKCQCAGNTVLKEGACIACEADETPNTDKTECLKTAVEFGDTANGNSFFLSGSVKFTESGATLVSEYKAKIPQITTTPICYVVVGHTDGQGIKTKKDACLKNNQTLSECRAKTVQSELGLTSANSRTFGKGSNDCTKKGNQAECRKIVVTAHPYDCTNIDSEMHNGATGGDVTNNIINLIGNVTQNN